MAEHEIAYRYHKTKGRYYGIPARDLTQADYDRLPLELQVVVDAGSAYTAVEKKGGKTAGDGQKDGAK